MTDLSFDQAKNVEVIGSKLAVFDEGSGPPLIFVHGSSSDLRTWRKQVPAFSERFRTIAYSRRYARPNTDIADGVDDQMWPHVEDLHALMQVLQLPEAHLVGHSWGGFIALLTAIKYPNAVKSLTVIEPPVLTLFVSMPPRPKEILKVLFRNPGLALSIIRFGAGTIDPAQKAFRAGEDEKALKIFGRGLLGKRFFSNLSEERWRQVWENRKADRAQLLGAGFPPLSEKEVRSIKVPTLIFHSDSSAPLFRNLAIQIGRMIEGSQVRQIGNSSHLLHEEQPEEVNRAILDFLASIR